MPPWSISFRGIDVEFEKSAWALVCARAIVAHPNRVQRDKCPERTRQLNARES
jgi:hypothetical protein